MISLDKIYFAPFEKLYEKLTNPFEEFIHRQTTSGMLLIICAIFALVIGNSPFLEHYDKIIHAQIGFHVGGWKIEHSFHHWINDGLMTVFFFVVGLEIKREFLLGDLSKFKNAILPIGAAIGGMVFPALIYFAFNGFGYGSRGWGIPMATDIAFAVGVLSLLGNRIPRALLIFLVTLAIVDDLGAVTIIALFYTDELNFYFIAIGAVITSVMYFLNLLGIRSSIPYFLLAFMLWITMEGSGVHATIAGIIASWTIPAYSRFSPKHLSNEIRTILEQFDQTNLDDKPLIMNPEQTKLAWKLGKVHNLGISPLQKQESGLHIPVAFFIIPLFALANAAIPLDIETINNALTDSISIGIVLGLIFGKVLGICVFVKLLEISGIAVLPKDVSFDHIIGAGLLAGIGFTMSIFISDLAFEWDSEVVIMAKMGILFASVISGLLGYFWLLHVCNRNCCKRTGRQNVKV